MDDRTFDEVKREQSRFEALPRPVQLCHGMMALAQALQNYGEAQPVIRLALSTEAGWALVEELGGLLGDTPSLFNGMVQVGEGVATVFVSLFEGTMEVSFRPEQEKAPDGRIKVIAPEGFDLQSMRRN